MIVLSHKAKKLMTLCEAAGFRDLNDLVAASLSNTMCAAICMTEGCDHIAQYEKDQDEGYCEACGANIVG